MWEVKDVVSARICWEDHLMCGFPAPDLPPAHAGVAALRVVGDVVGGGAGSPPPVSLG